MITCGAGKARSAHLRIHGTTRRRPVDLFEQERQHLKALPHDPYEICELGKYKVRKDCHVHVRGNYYSVPYRYVARRVLVRTSESTLTMFSDGRVLAQHSRLKGLGQTSTNPSHYPLTKQVSTQEIHRLRCQTVRSAGPYAAEYLHQIRQSSWVTGPQVKRLAGLIREHGADAVDQACHRALFFRAVDGAPLIERILDQQLHTLPIDDMPADLRSSGEGDYGRPLKEYALLCAVEEVCDE